MTARVLTGSKQEIAQKVASFDGDVREAIIFVEESTDRRPPAAQGIQDVADIFAEMEPYMVHVADVDDSREALYTRQEDE